MERLLATNRADPTALVYLKATEDGKLLVDTGLVSGSGGSGATGGLTDAQLRAADVPVVTPLPASPITGQGKISTTGTAVQLVASALKNGIVVKANPNNAQPLFVGGLGVTNTNDGTGNGYRLDPGEAISFAVANANSIYINGTAGDIFYFAGN